MSCAPNCSIDATYIDIYQSHINKREKPKYKDQERIDAMKRIRRTHICQLCLKYPGDSEWTFGIWEKNTYTCFDCLR